MNILQFILGVDIGTTNTKVIAYSLNGEILTSSQVSYTPIVPEQGWHELDPRILMEAALTAAASVIAAMKQEQPSGEQPSGTQPSGAEPSEAQPSGTQSSGAQPSDAQPSRTELPTSVKNQSAASSEEAVLKAVGFSTAMHGLIAVDENGTPLTNMITWADLRATEYAKELRGSALGILVHNKTGTPVHSMSPLCKLMWLREHRQEIFNTAFKFVSIKEYILFHLFGSWVIDHSIASATGLFDIQDKEWFAPALELAGITADRLPDPVPTNYILKGLKQEYATRLNIDPDIPFVIGASDGCLANAGSGAVEPGEVSLTIGTSGAVRMVTQRPMEDKQQRLFNYILTDKIYVSGGPINNGAFLLKWYSENFLDRPFNGAKDFQWFTEQAAQVSAGCGGLVFLPYIQGERAPVWDSEAKGVFFGVHSSHNRLHFMRAVIEGISFALKEVMDSLEEVIAPVQTVYASGGFIQSPVWVQLLADILGKPIIINDKADASSIGAAMLAANAIGLSTEFPSRDIQKDAQVVVSRPEEHAKYRSNYAIYRELYAKLKSEFSRV